MNNYTISSTNSRPNVSFKAFHAPSRLEHGAERLKKVVSEIKVPDPFDIVDLMRSDLEQGYLVQTQVEELVKILQQKGLETSYLNARDMDRHVSAKNYHDEPSYLFDFFKNRIENSKAMTEKQLSGWEKVKEVSPTWLYYMLNSLDESDRFLL